MTRSLAALPCLVLAAAGAAADTFHVAPGGADDPARDGRTPAAAWATLAYACDRVPAGPHTVALAPGAYPATRTARPKDGVTVDGGGADKARVVASAAWPLGDVTADPKPAGEFLVALDRAKGVTVRGVAFASDPAHRVSGAVRASGCKDLRLEGLDVREFRWAGVYVEHSERVAVAGCRLHNASTDKDRHHSGAIRTRWPKDSEVRDCVVTADVGRGYGYKGSGHERMRFVRNTVDVPGEFAFESAHDNEFGLEVAYCHLTRCVSVPKPGQGADPAARGCEYSVRVHHNLLTDSYAVEGPRSHLRVDHNYIRIAKTGGRVYSQHGGDCRGPVRIDHNVVENLDRALVWKNRGTAFDVRVDHNTVFCADAGERAAAIIDTYKGDEIRDWKVRNNVFVAPADRPRKLFQDKGGAGRAIRFEANLCVNVTGGPAGTLAGGAAFKLTGRKPWPHYEPAAGLVDRGVDAGHPFRGKAPDLGAVEAGDPDPFAGVPVPR